MKVVFLVLYLWHGNNAAYSNNAFGGPSFTVTPMPNIKICEKVGKQAKELADSRYNARYYVADGWSSVKRYNTADFWCIEEDDK